MLKKIFDEENIGTQKEVAWIIANISNCGTHEQMTLMTTNYAALFNDEQISKFFESIRKLKATHDRERDGKIHDKVRSIIEAIMR